MQIASLRGSWVVLLLSRVCSYTSNLSYYRNVPFSYQSCTALLHIHLTDPPSTSVLQTTCSFTRVSYTCISHNSTLYNSLTHPPPILHHVTLSLTPILHIDLTQNLFSSCNYCDTVRQQKIRLHWLRKIFKNGICMIYPVW